MVSKGTRAGEVRRGAFFNHTFHRTFTRNHMNIESTVHDIRRRCTLDNHTDSAFVAQNSK